MEEFLPSEATLEDVKTEEEDIKTEIKIEEEEITPYTFVEDPLAITPEELAQKGVKRPASLNSPSPSESQDRKKQRSIDSVSQKISELVKEVEKPNIQGTPSMAITSDAKGKILILVPSQNLKPGESRVIMQGGGEGRLAVKTGGESRLLSDINKTQEDAEQRLKKDETHAKQNPSDAASISTDSSFEDHGFYNFIQKTENGKTVIRSNAESEKQAKKWVELFSRKLNLNLAINKVYKASQAAFHCEYICNHGDKDQVWEEGFVPCKVTINVKVMVPTKSIVEKVSYVKQFPCFIVIKGEHSHDTETLSSQTRLAVHLETKGQSVECSEAARVASIIQYKFDRILTELASHAISPSRRAVSHLREAWGLEGSAVLSAIRKYAEESPNTKIELDNDGNKFVAVLVTDFMMRVHGELREACEVVFVDTTWHVEEHITIITLHCAGPAVAAPLGVIFTSSQDEASYTTGFSLLKRVLGDRAFFGCGHPRFLISDNSQPLRTVLWGTWPESSLYHGIYHILQQTWRWLCDSSHNIRKEDRSQLIDVAENLVYSKTQDEFRGHWVNFCNASESQQYPLYTRCLSMLTHKEKDWSLMDRMLSLQSSDYGVSTIIHVTTMCVVKDAILNRCKGFNTFQLIIFMNEIYDTFLKQRLVDVALGRLKPHTSASIGEADIMQQDKLTFSVKSDTGGNVTYRVDMKAGICDCTQGQTEDVCKHQVACADKCLHQLQNHSSSSLNHQWLAGVALGHDKVIPAKFFAVLETDGSESSVSNTVCSFAVPSFQNKDFVSCSSSISEDRCGNRVEGNDMCSGEGNMKVMSQEAVAPINVKPFLDCFTELIHRYGDNSTQKLLDAFTQRLRNIRSSSELNALLNTLSRGVRD